MAEPLRMIAHPGMIRRALKGDIQSDLETVLGCGVTQDAEVVDRAQFGVDCGVPAHG